MDAMAKIRHMKPRHHAWLACGSSLLLLIALFGLWPDLDNQVSRLVYDPALPGFPAKQIYGVLMIYKLAPMVNQALLLLSLLVLLIAWIRPASINVKWRRRCQTWVVMMVLGLGVVVDWALKDHVGRVRPEYSQMFGGPLDSRPLLEWDQACDNNCSFVSGHAAGGFALMAWGMWAPRRQRQPWIALGLFAGTGIGAIRIAQGGHFLSDVMFAGWVICMMYLLIQHTWLHWRLRQIRTLRN